MTLDQLVAQVCIVFASLCAAPKPSEPAKLDPDTTRTNQLVPSKAQPYIKTLTQISKNPSREAALTEQESAWTPKARSPYAKGLRQFTDSTGKWASKTICRKLGSYRPYDADWSLRCGVIYVEHLNRNNHYSRGYCFNRFVAEQEYNGGSWVIRELKRAGKENLWEARKHCRRARWACKENYEYPQRISKRQKKYLTLGGKYCIYR
jgi:soluble lytic murein transglycosylase-like protein